MFEIPTPVPGVATFPSVQVPDSGVASREKFGLGNKTGLPFADA